jgi:hypothetical protein
MIELKLHKPNYFLIPIDNSLLTEYSLGFSLGDIFKVKGHAIKTNADELLINTKLDRLKSNIDDYMNSKSTIEVGEFTKSKGIDLNGKYKIISYRIFDSRYYYDSTLTNVRCQNLTKHESIKGNYYLNFKSGVAGRELFSHICISKNVADNAIFTGGKASHSVPLYIYIEDNYYLNFTPCVVSNHKYTHILITKQTSEAHLFAGKLTNHSAPLYLKDNSND